MATLSEEEQEKLIELGFVKHQVMATDTLTGIALKYGVTIDEIKKTNKLFTNDVCVRKVIYVRIGREDKLNLREIVIESSETQLKRKLVKQFKMKTNCTDSNEITSYLVDNDWDLQKSIENYLNDIKWENENLKLNANKGNALFVN
eukprot:TRINITY_DN1185_c3_g2_i1.p1 TRINITY_DN1185_c3_g2~~TRINITY_DN1185_c3_g2_i1.p1  ORF type:complete len:170 (-),score=71.92 TRINITY_DN1185_c3_g2_i1:48-485(-)